MDRDIVFWLLMGFLVLCSVAIVLECIGHYKDKKHEREMAGFLQCFLKRVFKPGPLDAMPGKKHPKDDHRPS